MNPIYNFFAPHSGESAEKVEARRLFLGISDELIFQKLLLGFFESGLKNYRTEKNDPKAYTHLEYFAGSLTARLFRGLLIEFLSTQNALETLDPKAIEAIHLFLNASQKGADQAFSIDLIRSQDMRFVLLALTGSDLWIKIGGDFSVEKSEMDELIQMTLDRVDSLQVGETISFLTGKPAHDTQFALHRRAHDQWECYVCDSEMLGAYVFTVPKEEVLSHEFWQNIYTQKLSKGSFIENRFCTECTASVDIAPQKYGTCHFKSLLSLLKIFLTFRTTLSGDRKFLDWHQFQVTFGNFLLAKMTPNDPGLTEVCQLSHQKDVRQLKEISFFHQGILDGKYEEIRETYLEIFKRFGIEFYLPSLEGKSPLECLLALHHELIGDLNRYHQRTFDHIVSILSEIDSPYLHYTLDCFKNKYLKKQRVAEQQLLDEIANFSSSSHIFSEMHFSAISFINHFIEEYIPPELGVMRQTRLGQFQPVATNLDTLKKYLSIFEKNPQWLVNLDAKRSFADLLIQGIYTGCLEEVGFIFSKLNPKDAHWFATSIDLVSKVPIPNTMLRHLLDHIDASPNIRGTLIDQATAQLHLPTLLSLYDSTNLKELMLTMFAIRLNVNALLMKERLALEEAVSHLDSSHPVTSLLKKLLSQPQSIEMGPELSD